MLTIPVVVLLLQPLWGPQFGAGVLGEIASVGATGATLVIVAFLGAAHWVHTSWLSRRGAAAGADVPVEL